MSDGQHAAEHAGHPSVKFYLAIAAILTVVTLVEVAIFYIPAIADSPFLAPVLLALSSVKFALVVMFYMHLKPDSRVFSAIFVAPLALGVAVVLALIALIR